MRYFLLPVLSLFILAGCGPGSQSIVSNPVVQTTVSRDGSTASGDSGPELVGPTPSASEPPTTTPPVGRTCVTQTNGETKCGSW